MKFPYKLSKERLSLLSKKDREIYEREHAPKIQSVFASVSKVSDTSDKFYGQVFENADEIIETDGSSDSSDFYRSIIKNEIDELYRVDYSDIIPIEEYEAIRAEIIETISPNSDEHPNDVIEHQSLNEAEGQDAYAWIRGLNLGWLGKLAAAALGLLGTAIAYLLIQGKDKIARDYLKYYMNRLVERTDQGIYKKVPWYRKLVMKKSIKNNLGEWNNGCFRTIQETSDRNMVTATMMAAHKLGYFASGQMMSIANGSAPQDGSGLSDFKKNVVDQLQMVAPNPDPNRDNEDVTPSGDDFFS